MKNIKLWPLLFLFSWPAYSGISADQLKQVEQLEGSYKVQKGSDKSCSGGLLKIVGKQEDEKGIMLGQSIFIGPFQDVYEKPDSKSCRVVSKFKMDDNSIVLKTTVDKCPDKRHKEEGKTTQHLTIKGKSLEYKVDETGYVCLYSKMDEVKK